MPKVTQKNGLKERRRARVRAKVIGSAARPRLNVFRSLRGMFVQIIDDESSKTLVSVNSKKDAVGDLGDKKAKVGVSYLLGKKIAEKAVAAGIKQVVFDRGSYRYHGRVKAVADGAREGGLEF